MSASRTLALTGILLFGSAVTLSAQGAPDEPVGYGAVHAGLIGLDLGEVNARLAAASLPALDETVPMWGGGGYGVVGRWHLGAVGHGGLDPASVSGTQRVSMVGGYGLARARYRALSFGGVSLYPAVGLGAGGLSLQIAELSAPTFDEVLGDPERSSTLSTGVFLLLDAGLGLEYRFQVQELEDGGGWGLTLGVEGGYLYTPGSTSWKLDGVNDVSVGPGLGIEGFYVWISLGGWGREGMDR